MVVRRSLFEIAAAVMLHLTIMFHRRRRRVNAVNL
ncbi:hypothetical protein SOVF_174770 [Spinacia oleracea]|nr:hypothetical protein SOVF_174770 [Spinacia oleracea]